MARKTKAEIKAEMQRAAKRVRDRNYRFRLMPKDKQRVRIAKDVVEQVNAQRFIARQGLYLHVLDDSVSDKLTQDLSTITKVAGSEYGYYDTPTAAEVERAEELKKVELQPLIANAKCEVCGIGACFVAALDRADDLSLSTVAEADGGYGNDDYMREYLSRWFDDNQLDLIEVAFEARRNSSFVTQSFVTQSAAERFGLQHIDPDARLVAIMENIIENDGIFDPLTGIKED